MLPEGFACGPAMCRRSKQKEGGWAGANGAGSRLAVLRFLDGSGRVYHNLAGELKILTNCSSLFWGRVAFPGKYFISCWFSGGGKIHCPWYMVFIVVMD